MRNTKSEFEIVYDTLINECIYGNSMCLMWKRLSRMKNEYPLLFDNGDYFWGIANLGISDSALHRLFKVFNEAKGSTNIFDFFKEVHKVKHNMKHSTANEIDNELKNDLKSLEERSELLIKLKTIRNKYYTHLDKNEIKNLNKLFEDNSVSVDDVSNLYKLIGEILNKYMSFFSGSTTAIGFIDDMNVNDFLEILEELLEKEEKQRMDDYDKFLRRGD